MRYILKHIADDNDTGIDKNKIRNILSTGNARIVDDGMFPDMTMIEIEEAHVQQLQNDLGGQWKLFPEIKYKVPDTKKKLR